VYLETKLAFIFQYIPDVEQLNAHIIVSRVGREFLFSTVGQKVGLWIVS